MTVPSLPQVEPKLLFESDVPQRLSEMPPQHPIVLAIKAIAADSLPSDPAASAAAAAQSAADAASQASAALTLVNSANQTLAQLDPDLQSAAGTMTGAETQTVKQGSSFVRATLSAIATFILSIFTILIVSGPGAVARTILEWMQDRPISVMDFGAECDGVLLAYTSITSGSTTFGSISANFSPADVGKVIAVGGAGPSGGQLLTTIAAFINATTVTLAAAASTSVSGIIPTFYGTDDTAAWQSALNKVAAKGGAVLQCAPCITLIGGAGLSHTLAVQGLVLQAHGVQMVYTGTGTGLTVTRGGGGVLSTTPIVSLPGLNVVCTGAAAAGIQCIDCAEGRLTDTYVTATGAAAGGSVVNAYVLYCGIPYYSENITMERCGASGFSNAAIAFMKDPSVQATGSFARFSCRDFFISQTAAQNVYVIDVQGGSVYDSRIDMIRGNFNGQAFIRIRNGADMEGSRVSGFYTEYDPPQSGPYGPYGFVFVDNTATTKLPVILEYGNYVKNPNWVSSWITTNNAAFTPVYGYKALNIESPVVVDALLTGNSIGAVGGPVETLLQHSTLSVGSGTQSGTITTTNSIWANGVGAAGKITAFISSSGGAGGSVAEITFAGEGAAVSASTAVPQSVTRPGMYPLTISSVSVNTNGTVNIGWTWNGGPSITLTWTVTVKFMPI
jgi:hypothetical protein